MYSKPIFEPEDRDEVYRLIDDLAFGTLVSAGAAGLVVSHLIFLLDRTRGQSGTLMSHLAAANPHCDAIRAGAPSVAVFEGPHGYISSSWYPGYPARDSAPTWNFSVVHAHGRPAVVDQKATIRHLDDVVAHMERGRDRAWQMKELGPGGMARRLPHILAFELPVERLEAKFKMGQDERRPDTLAAIDELRAEGRTDLAEVMARKNAGRTD